MNTQQPLTVSEAGFLPFSRVRAKLNALIIAGENYITVAVAKDALAYDSEQPERFFHDLGVTQNRGRKNLNPKLFKTLQAFKDPEAFCNAYEFDEVFKDAIEYYYPDKSAYDYSYREPFAIKLAYRYTATDIANQLGMINPPIKEHRFTETTEIEHEQAERLRKAYEQADSHIKILNDIVAKQPHSLKAFYAKKALEYDPKYPGLFFQDCEDYGVFLNRHRYLYDDKHGVFFDTYSEELKELFHTYVERNPFLDPCGYAPEDGRTIDEAMGQIMSYGGEGLLGELAEELGLNDSIFCL